MIRKLLVLLLAAAAAALCSAAASASRVDDRVTLRVETASIDGALLFSAPDGWSWRCTSPVCTVTTPRGTQITIAAENGTASAFEGWEGPCPFTPAGTCTITVSDDQVVVKARFSPLRLWLPSFGGGSIAVEPYRPTASPLVGRSCGFECVDYPNGVVLRLRAVANPGYHMVGWGGTCSNVPANHNCLHTMNRNAVVSATFERDQPQSSTPGVVQQPVGAASDFSLQVYGDGSVVVPSMGMLPGTMCSPSCRFSRDIGRWVDLKAIARPGSRFLGWSGPCSGTGICHFYNRGYGRTPSAITARFG